MPDTEQRTEQSAHVDETLIFTAQLQCRYLLRVPQKLPDKPALAVTLHGYGSQPDAMLRFMSSLLGPEWVIASLQAPYQHYVPNSAERNPGYNWGIHQHWESAVVLHHEMVLHVLEAAGTRIAIPPSRRLLAGFSQAVGLNYRFCATYTGTCGGVLAICGGVPRDWEEDKYQPVPAPILHIARDEDEFYPVSLVSEFPRRLRLHAPDVEFHLLPGKHRFPSRAHTVVHPWLHRVFGPLHLPPDIALD